MLESHQPKEDLHVVIRGGKSHRFLLQLIWTCARCHKGIVKIWCVHNPYGNTCTSVAVGSTPHAGMLHWIQVKKQTEEKQWWNWQHKAGNNEKAFVFVCVCMCWTCARRGCCENKLRLTRFLSLPWKYENRPGPGKLLTFHWTALGGNTRNTDEWRAGLG